MRVTPTSTLPEQQSWCCTLWSQCSVADISVVLTGLGPQFALHSCSSQASFPIIPLSQFLLRALMTSILPNPVVPSLSSSASTSQPLSSKWHSLLQLLQHSPSLGFWELPLFSKYCSYLPGCFFRVLCANPSSRLNLSALQCHRIPLGRLLFCVYTSFSTPGSQYHLHTQLSQASLSNPDLSIGFQAGIFNSLLNRVTWILTTFFFWIFCSQSFSFFSWLHYTNELIICWLFVGCHLGTKVLVKGYEEI